MWHRYWKHEKRAAKIAAKQEREGKTDVMETVTATATEAMEEPDDATRIYATQVAQWRALWLDALITGLISSHDTTRAIVASTLLSDVLSKHDTTCLHPLLHAIHHTTCDELARLRAVIMVLTTARRHVSVRVCAHVRMCTCVHVYMCACAYDAVYDEHIILPS